MTHCRNNKSLLKCVRYGCYYIAYRVLLAMVFGFWPAQNTQSAEGIKAALFLVLILLFLTTPSVILAFYATNNACNRRLLLYYNGTIFIGCLLDTILWYNITVHFRHQYDPELLGGYIIFFMVVCFICDLLLFNVICTARKNCGT